MKPKLTMWAMVRDLQRYAEVPAEIDGMEGANVGALMAAAMGAVTGVAMCETDWLVARGATFPERVPAAVCEAFNRATMREDMTEADERSRYEQIARLYKEVS